MSAQPRGRFTSLFFGAREKGASGLPAVSGSSSPLCPLLCGRGHLSLLIFLTFSSCLLDALLGAA